MEMIMERNSDGKVTIGDNSATIPKNELALFMFGTNPVFDKAEYRKDGLIYVDDKPVRKWFRDCYLPGGNSRGVRIWQPILSDIVSLEARRWRMKERVEKFYNDVWKPAFELVVKAGGAHAEPTHKFTGDKTWWLYTIHDYGDSHSISFDWVDTPTEPKAHETGQQYYLLDRQMERYYGYANRFNVVLESAIAKYLRKEHPPERAGITFRLVLNGRNYWYASGYVGHSVEWIKINWPGSQMIEVFM